MLNIIAFGFALIVTLARYIVLPVFLIYVMWTIHPLFLLAVIGLYVWGYVEGKRQGVRKGFF